MALLENLRERCSAKEFLPFEMSVEDQKKIKEAMSYSPRAGNLQHFIVGAFTQEKSREQLSALLMNSVQVKTASLVLIFFVDLSTSKKWFEENRAEYPFLNLVGLEYGLMDAMCAAQSASLVAEDLGYGTCYIGSALLRSVALSTYFKCAPGVIPAFALTIGKPVDTVHKRHNLPVESFVLDEPTEIHQSPERVYSSTGKQVCDWAHYSSQEEISSKFESREIGSLPQLYSTLKYLPHEMHLCSNNLADLLRKSGIDLAPPSKK